MFLKTCDDEKWKSQTTAAFTVIQTARLIILWICLARDFATPGVHMRCSCEFKESLKHQPYIPVDHGWRKPHLQTGIAKFSHWNFNGKKTPHFMEAEMPVIVFVRATCLCPAWQGCQHRQIFYRPKIYKPTRHCSWELPREESVNYIYKTWSSVLRHSVIWWMGARVSEGHTTSILRVATCPSETVVTSCQPIHCLPTINHHTGANIRSVSNPYVMPFVLSKHIFTILGKHVRQARYVTYGRMKKWFQMAEVL
jgi:hypothetical protein